VRDLVLLVPDKNTEYTLRGALSRPQALGIRQIDFEILVEQGRDGGVRRRGIQVIEGQSSRFSHALVILDYEGCGSNVPASGLEQQLDAGLSDKWGDRGKAIVIEPELDIWMWGADSHLRAMLDWTFPEDVRAWLVSESFVFDADGKPERPKEALEAACKRAQTPRSSARYEQVARRISLTKCKDPAYQRLRVSLVTWFGTAESAPSGDHDSAS